MLDCVCCLHFVVMFFTFHFFVLFTFIFVYNHGLWEQLSLFCISVHIPLSVRWLFPQRAQTNNWGRFSEAATTGGPSSLHSPPNCLFFTKRTPRMNTTNASTTTTMSPPVPLRQQQERQYQWRQQQERERIKTKKTMRLSSLTRWPFLIVSLSVVFALLFAGQWFLLIFFYKFHICILASSSFAPLSF